MPATASLDDPSSERRARPELRRATFSLLPFHPSDPTLLALVRGWEREANALLAQGELAPDSRLRVGDAVRILGELSRVLAGEEPGEGRDADRLVWVAVARGHAQGVCAAFLCPRGVFVELLATAPWNLLGAGDPPDGRAVRGAGSALVAHASAVSRAAGRGGRVALQAENGRCLAAYAKMGFARMRPSDLPLALVPRGDAGWSESVLRLARGRAGPEEARQPWLVLDPSRATPSVRVRPEAPPRAVAA